MQENQRLQWEVINEELHDADRYAHSLMSASNKRNALLIFLDGWPLHFLVVKPFGCLLPFS